LVCDICGSEEATIHIRQVTEGETVELALCARCAAVRGISAGEGPSFSVSDLLTGLIDVKKRVPQRRKICPRCGQTLENLKKRQRVGCNECYVVFGKEIRGLLGRMHGKAQHRGKLPRRLATYKTLLVDVEALKRRLRAAVRNENYEEAAKIRDRIAELNAQGEDD
jgi:protein arginine kinase activator